MKPTFDPDIDAVVEQQGGHFIVWNRVVENNIAVKGFRPQKMTKV